MGAELGKVFTMPDLFLPVTFTFICALAIVIVPMTAWIGLTRDKYGVLRGDGGNAILFKRIRAHGNLIENAPAFALALGVAELTGLSAGWLWAAVLSFLLGRISHFILYDRKTRGIAMSLTQMPAAAMGIWVLLQIW